MCMHFFRKFGIRPSNERRKKLADMQKMVDKEGGKFKIESWDWWYYAEKVRKEKFDLDEEQLRPYFELNNVRDGAFAVANKLYGLTFTKLGKHAALPSRMSGF